MRWILALPILIGCAAPIQKHNVAPCPDTRAMTERIRILQDELTEEKWKAKLANNAYYDLLIRCGEKDDKK